MIMSGVVVTAAVWRWTIITDTVRAMYAEKFHHTTGSQWQVFVPFLWHFLNVYELFAIFGYYLSSPCTWYWTDYDISWCPRVRTCTWVGPTCDVVCGCVCITFWSHQSQCSQSSLAPSIFNGSSPNLEHGLPDKWRISCTIYSQTGFIQCACTATDFLSNEIFSVNRNRRNSSLMWFLPNLVRQ